MKKNIAPLLLMLFATVGKAQEVLRIKNGSSITIQNGAELSLQGGISLENGSSILNNGSLRLKNNAVANASDWIDNSAAGALSGTGMVIFNSNNNHNFSGTTNFYAVQVNAGNLTLNNNFPVSNLLHLINGKINTGSNYIFLNNNNVSSLLNDGSNTGYANSWVNGNFRRSIAANTSTYDFPVGNTIRSNQLQFANNNLSGTNYLTASFGIKPGTDAGLSASENGATYTAINNGGVWYLNPDNIPSGGNYGLQLYFNGFTGLTDNQFGILRRTNASSNAADWIVPAGSTLEVNNGLGRKLSDGYARRIQISDFSQFGIGMLSNVPNDAACSHVQQFYGDSKGTACYTINGTATTISSSQLMLNAFGNITSKVFGNVPKRQFFTLFKTDISNGNIFKMFPGTGNSLALGVDNISPFDGAYYSDQNTWYLVPIPTSGNQKGKINNLLLSQVVSLWFNLLTSSSLSVIDLSNDTLLTRAQTNCGSGMAAGNTKKFGLPHNVVVYLNGGNGYTNNINGLFQLANDVLGGANTSISPVDVQNAIAAINNAFDGCRILTGTIAYAQPALITKISNANSTPFEIVTEKLLVSAFPNPYNRQFSLNITSPVSGMATIEFFSGNGARIYQTRKFVTANAIHILPYTGSYHAGAVLYRVNIGSYKSSGFVIHPN